MSGSGKSDKNYYLNYLNANANANVNAPDDEGSYASGSGRSSGIGGMSADASPTAAGFVPVPGDESSIDEMSHNPGISRDENDDDDDDEVESVEDYDSNAVLSSYRQMERDININIDIIDDDDDDDSIVDIDTVEDSNDVSNETETDDCSEKEETNRSQGRMAAAGTYLSMDANGKVVESFSLMRSNSNINEDERSISSVPRTSLPPPSDGTRTATSSLLGNNNNEQDYEEKEKENDSSFLLPPPDATDYAPAEFVSEPPNYNSNFNDLTRLQASRSNNSSNNKTAAAMAAAAFDKENLHHLPDDEAPGPVRAKAKAVKQHNNNNNNNKTILSKRDKERLRAEEEAASAHLLGKPSVEVPPPMPNNNNNNNNNTYSHLLKAYEFVEDPSIPPLPPPPKEFVQSPTDEKHMDTAANLHKQGLDVSYEDDIEVGEQNRQHQQQESPRARKSRSGLFTIFSPRRSTPNNDKDASKTGTPDTDVLSTNARAANDNDNDNDNDLSGRQLSFDSSDEDASALTGGYRRSKKSSRRSRFSRKAMIVICVVIFLVIAAAATIIGYAMFVKFKQQTNNTNTASEFVVDIATGSSASSSSSSAPADSSASDIVIAITNNQTANSNSNSAEGGGSFEWVDASSLRPVTLKKPTAEPTEAASPDPTVSPLPTQSPTRIPTNKPTEVPTSEGDFVGRLQDLLQERNFRDANGQLFVFDFSTNDSLNDPANLALVYLARETAATMGVPNKDTYLDGQSGGPESKETETGPELGNVVVTIGDAEPPPLPSTPAPDFYPILLRNYDDEKLVQRFALLALQFAATSALSASSSSNPFASKKNDDNIFQQDDVTTAAVMEAQPMKRVVFMPDALTEATSGSSNNGNNNDSNTPPKQTSPPKDPYKLADPKDVRFLVDECDWDGVECSYVGNSTTSSVTKLRWDYKDLDGSIASTLGLLTSLTFLDMSNNQLRGSIPETLYDLSNLEELYLFKNGLTGSLSTSVGKLDKLNRFHLSHNSLTGTLPTELKSDGGSELGIRPIHYFNVYSNNFTGSLPNELRWRQCSHFDVGRNQLTGTLPEDIGDKFIELRHLFLDHNAFTGTLPESYNDVGNGRLVALSIESNQLTGVVPGVRESYDNLVQFTLQDNQFTSLESETCDNYYLVEFKADCPNVCTCFGRFFDFCERWCGYESRRDRWQQRQNQPPRNNWSF